MKVKRKIIEIDEEKCDGCGNCILSCAEGALEIIDGKAKVVSDNLCDGLGACLGDCPQDALQVIEREAEDFDEEAVEERLTALKKADGQNVQIQPQAEADCGCPGARIAQFPTRPAARPEDAFVSPESSESGLSHWPVQIRLVPPHAPFLKGADLLVVADCVPVAYPSFHRDFLKGKAVMLGCPKFDEVDAYVEKFAAICKQSGVKSITTVVMEVPCCAGLPVIVKKGMQMSGVAIPLEEVVVTTRGKILQQ